MRRMPIITWLVIFLWIVPASAATYYVRTDGNNSNAGTTDSAWGAWLTIGKCVTDMVAGDTCIVGNGTYVSGSINFATSGSEGNPITLRAQNKHQAIISSTSGCQANISTNASYDFWVHSVDGSGNLSATVSGGSFTMPAQSANVVITLDRNTEADMSSYLIRAAVGPTCTKSSPILTSVPHPTTTWTGSVPATVNALYAFCMTAVDRTGNESGISNTITKEIVVTLGPIQPSGLTVQVIP